MIADMKQMVPGESRWMGRTDLHVYCFGTWVNCVYRRDLRAWKLWTADLEAKGGSPWDRDGWMTAEQVAQLIKQEMRNDR